MSRISSAVVPPGADRDERAERRVADDADQQLDALRRHRLDEEALELVAGGVDRRGDLARGPLDRRGALEAEPHRAGVGLVHEPAARPP